jgi:hypothetical protein
LQDCSPSTLPSFLPSFLQSCNSAILQLVLSVPSVLAPVSTIFTPIAPVLSTITNAAVATGINSVLSSITTVFSQVPAILDAIAPIAAGLGGGHCRRQWRKRHQHCRDHNFRQSPHAASCADAEWVGPGESGKVKSSRQPSAVSRQL